MQRSYYAEPTLRQQELGSTSLKAERLSKSFGIFPPDRFVFSPLEDLIASFVVR